MVWEEELGGRLLEWAEITVEREAGVLGDEVWDDNNRL